MMMIDGALFCGSLNLANSYTSVRYGDGSFRDINIILQRGSHPGGKRVRDFFRNMILKNEYFYPLKIQPDQINKAFDELDAKYAWQEAEEAYPEGWPPKEIKASLTPKDEDISVQQKILDLKNKEVSIFLEESPPSKTEVSTAVLEMIKRAEKSIKIIQPYVTNVDELEDLLREAARDRGVQVEIITARIRD